MNKNHKIRTETQGLLPTFSKLLAVMLAVLFLAASCSKNDPVVDSEPPPMGEPMNLRGVYIDLEAGLITGTTVAMEYSLNSTNGVDGTWTVAGDGNTSVIFKPGKVFVREAANHDNARMVVAFGPGMIIIVDLEVVGINIVEGHITETTSGLEYSLNSTNGTDGDWTLASDGDTAVEFVAGNVYVRDNRQPNNFRLVATIAPAVGVPAFTHDDDANTIIGLSGIHEYKINEGDWTAVTGTPIFAGDAEVQVRVKATVTELASEIQTFQFTISIVMYENFEGYSTGDAKAWLTSIGWTGFDGSVNYDIFYSGIMNNPHPLPVELRTVSFPHGGNNGLYISRGGKVQKDFARNKNVVLEWKIYRFQHITVNDRPGTSHVIVSLFSGDDEVARVCVFNLQLRSYRVKGSVATSTPATDYYTLKAFTGTWHEKWDTYRIVLNEDRYEFHVWDHANNEYERLGISIDGVLNTDFATFDGRKEVDRVVFHNARNNEYVVVDDVRITQ